MADKHFIIVVNATEQTVENEIVTYDQIVKLAYPNPSTHPNITYSITFEHAKEPKQGTLARGGSVEVKPRNTEFDVIEANRS